MSARSRPVAAVGVVRTVGRDAEGLAGIEDEASAAGPAADRRAEESIAVLERGRGVDECIAEGEGLVEVGQAAAEVGVGGVEVDGAGHARPGAARVRAVVDRLLVGEVGVDIQASGGAVVVRDLHAGVVRVAERCLCAEDGDALIWPTRLLIAGAGTGRALGGKVSPGKGAAGTGRSRAGAGDVDGLVQVVVLRDVSALGAHVSKLDGIVCADAGLVGEGVLLDVAGTKISREVGGVGWWVGAEGGIGRGRVPKASEAGGKGIGGTVRAVDVRDALEGIGDDELTGEGRGLEAAQRIERHLDGVQTVTSAEGLGTLLVELIRNADAGCSSL